MRSGRIRVPEQILNYQNFSYRRGLTEVLEQNPADQLQDLGVARKPSNRVEARSQRHNSFVGDSPMGRPKSEYSAVARWNAHRASSVCSKGEINQPSCNGSSRTARRSSGDSVWSSRIDWRPVVKILAAQTKRQFIGDSETAERRACIEQSRHRRSRAGRCAMSPKPVRVAGTSSYALDVEHIFQRKAQSGGDAPTPAISCDVCMGAECVKASGHLSLRLDFRMSEARRQ